MNNPDTPLLPVPQMPVSVRRLPTLGSVVKLNASSADIPALIAHLDLENISKFTAQLKFRPWARDGVQVEGVLSASLATQCPLTLKPVPQQIDAKFNAKFAPHTSKLAKPRLNDEGEMVLDVESDDIPDIYEGEELDAWAIAIEYLGLEIDFFLRAEGARFEQSTANETRVGEKPSPFGVLQSLKK